MIWLVACAMSWAAGTCASGDLDACAVDGGALLAEKKTAAGMAILEPACEQGGMLACYNIAAEHMRNGRVEEALPHFERTCTAQLAIGCADLGFIHATGAGVPRDAERGFRLTETGCQLGYAAACGEAAAMMVSGFGTTKDEKKAFKYMASACLQQHAQSCTKAASMAEQGIGAPKDLDAAATFYASACDGGDGTGCVNLATLENAREHFDVALVAATNGCDLNEGLACASAAMAHLRGRGVEADRAKAMTFFERACMAGYENGCKAIEELKK